MSSQNYYIPHDPSFRTLMTCAPDTVFVGVMVLIAVSFRGVWQRGERRGALMIDGSLLLYMVLLLVTGVIVDLALLPIPYLFTWSYLAVAFAMSNELAGEVVRASTLSAEVRSSERRWRSLLENVQLLVAGVDRRGCVDYVNPFYIEVTGFSSNELVGKPIGALLPPNARDGIEKEFEAAMSGEFRPRVERFLLTKNGEQRLVVWSSVLLRDRDGGATGMLSIGADVTDQRKAENAREAALAEIETLTRRLEDEVVYLKREITTTGRFDAIVGESDALRIEGHFFSTKWASYLSIYRASSWGFSRRASSSASAAKRPSASMFASSPPRTAT